MHYYQHHIGDFIKDTANLDDHQIATYLRMVWAYYTEEKPFTEDLDYIAFAMRSDTKTVGLILRHYFKETPDGWRHGRCDREISCYHSKKEKASASANARWNNANALRTHSDRKPDANENDANQEPVTKNQEPNEKEKSDTVSAEPKLACPYQEIVNLYHATLKELPSLKVLTSARKAYIKARWNEHGRDLSWWSKYFSDVKNSDFLCGRSESYNGRKTFIADLEWLVKPSNMAKVIEGKYNNTTGSVQTAQPTEDKKCAGCGILVEFGCKGKTAESRACARYEVVR